ncbi:superoxide-generating NADPH oxidase flavocytochrome [Heterostelium album PN500]|uniref:Superoxide-generating NADPH oxidase flavocytochrome n=1 Tax=Heterostelium pallidum (strain ATCC 26659 / Pp 5 / PN500) TaxID=670386 RepID=D3BIK1_HETP5|nr:superoxide-generating NADPH oxidase flavocytochrome [Heterostelium album PN500]EFA78625.1 superoxide-generating NADPH oxidase flavocytochrome [Heterostelium album PN500]|eukprot:XP_020430749.1 superoxide-generating NADPH oxidase flavocytochrome [Heterostelium album PN500]
MELTNNIENDKDSSNNNNNTLNIEAKYDIENNDNTNKKKHTRHRSTTQQSSTSNKTDNTIEALELPNDKLEKDDHSSISNENTIETESIANYSKLIKLKYWWWDKGISSLIFIFHILLNIGLVIKIIFHFRKSEFYPFFGISLLTARAGAAIININSALILLPVLRNFLSWLRGTWISTYVPIDRNLSYHKLCAIGITLEQYGLSAEYVSKYYLYYKSVPGITGHVLIVVLLLICSSSVERIRRPMFEIFYVTHHLFIAYFILLCFHGYQQILKVAPNSYMWVGAPVLFYVVERAIRLIRGNREVMLHLAKQHPSKVLELRMKKGNFIYKPGQFIFLNCPSIANYEWHPFTITSAPDENYISVHINIVGNWTGKLYKLMNSNEKLGVVQNEVLTGPDGGPILKIDGPFGAASEDVFNYKVLVLVGAGIGATPYSSILKHIKYQLKRLMSEQSEQGKEWNLPIEKVYFFWISRDKNSFEWFTYILHDVESELNDLVEIHTYLTGAIEISDWNAIVDTIGTMDTEQHSDFITGLKSQTLFGRPNWDVVFQELTKIHKKNTIGVFYCGPRPLAKEIKNRCSQYNGMEGCHIIFHKENF